MPRRVAVARSPSCVTSWSVLDSGIKPSSAGSGRSQSLAVAWVQSSGRLVAGEHKQLHVWDLQSERRLAELPLGTDATVTTLATNDNGTHWRGQQGWEGGRERCADLVTVVWREASGFDGVFVCALWMSGWALNSWVL